MKADNFVIGNVSKSFVDRDMKYRIRDAVDTETFALADICEAVLKESPTYTHMIFDRMKCANTIYSCIMRQNGNWAKIIVDENDRPVGGLGAWCGESDFGPDKVAHDITIMLDEEIRGRCLKEVIQLVEEYKNWATQNGAKVIKMGVSSGINIDKASKFFETLGFKRIGAMHGLVLGE
jgi:GNAT superfamily N-acetyltransferase